MATAPERKYIIDSKTGERYPVGGCRISNRPSKMIKFGAQRVLRNDQLPPAVDLRKLMSPVEEQGPIDCCVGNTLAGAYEFLIMKNKKMHVDVSRLFIYYNARELDSFHRTTMQDDGTTIEAGVEGLKKYGCCSENLYPYEPEKVNKKPPPECYREAEKYRIKDSMAVDLKLYEMLGCLAEGYPFAMGLRIFDSFREATSNDGRIAMPTEEELKNASVGYWHAMLTVGYSNLSKCFIVRNSWGEKWGDYGYCYIPYEYMCNANSCMDLHVIKLIDEPENRPQDDSVHDNYNWNTSKTKKTTDIENYPFSSFDCKYFWDLSDSFNYFSNTWHHGKISPFVWAKEFSFNPNDRLSLSSGDETTIYYILWIDQKSPGNADIARRLVNGNKNVKVDFRETMTMAEDHLLKYKNRIKKSSTFQIICHAYYKSENKGPLNLLRFLSGNEMEHVPVLVYTRDKSGLTNYLQNQSASMGQKNWQQRLFITSDSDELVEKAKDKITRK